MLTSRIVPGLLVCVVLAATAAGWRVHMSNRDRATAEFLGTQLHTADVFAATLQSELTGTARLMRLLASTVGTERHADARQTLLDAQIRCLEVPCFAGLAVYNGDARPIASSGRLPGFTAAAAQEIRAWASRPENVSHVRTTISGFSKPSLILTTPLSEGGRDGNARGVLAAEIELDALFGARPGSPQHAQMPTLVIDGRGNVVFRAGKPEMRLNNVLHRPPRCATCHQSFAHIERMLKTPRGVLQYSLHGTQQLAAATHFDFEGERWLVAMMAPKDAAVGVLATEFKQIGLLIFATVLVTGLAVHVTWTDERRRIQAKADAARRTHLEQSHAELTALNAKLESAAAEWRVTVDTIDAALMVLEPCGLIRRMNRVASDTLPGEPFSWIGVPTEYLTPHEPWDSALSLAKEAVESKNPTTARIHYATSGRTWDLWCRPPHGRSAVLVVARDVTSVVELQESLRHSETMAALGSVVVGVAHEVRNPLFTISSLVDAWSIQKQLRDPQPLLDALRREVGRVNSLMTELLEYGRPAPVVLEPCRLSAILNEAILACRAQAEARSVRVVLDSASDAEVWSDARRLPRVFINLITNAIQHSPTDSDVVVSASMPARSAIVTVRDHGSGFSEPDLPRLFTPFFCRRPGGFGLGLAISARIVAEHRGKVSAANHPDGGAILTVSLPLTPPDRQVRVCEGAPPC